VIRMGSAEQLMRTWLLNILVLITACFVVEGQITSNVFERVLFVRVGGNARTAVTASAFTMEQNGRQYIITAKHVVASLPETSSIEYFRDNKWVSLPVRIFKCDDPTDIAVLVAPYQITTAFDLPADTSKVAGGQEVFFLGFPYGITLNGTNINGTLPLPFTKRAIYSGSILRDPVKHSVQILLDGYNNPGFSGGPIVYRDLSSRSLDYMLLGVVSGCPPEVTEVMEKHSIRNRESASQEAKDQPWRIVTNPDGSMFEYLGTQTYVALNTGIVTAFAIFPAIDIIKAHPVGPTVDTKKVDFPSDR